MNAARTGSPEGVKMLLDAKADPNQVVYIDFFNQEEYYEDDDYDYDSITGVHSKCLQMF